MNTNSPLKSSSKADRKTIEKNRRIHMKCLYSQLHSLVNHHASSSSRVVLSLPEQIDEATIYIKKLQENLKKLKKKKDNLISTSKGISNKDSAEKISRKYYNNRSSAVQIEINEKGNSVLEVILISGLECQFVFTEAIRIFHEEKAQIVNASYSVHGNTVFHTIHAQIKEDSISNGVARIAERLNNASFLFD